MLVFANEEFTERVGGRGILLVDIEDLFDESCTEQELPPTLLFGLILVLTRVDRF